jgi:hypothetical protein
LDGITCCNLAKGQVPGVAGGALVVLDAGVRRPLFAPVAQIEQIKLSRIT